MLRSFMQSTVVKLRETSHQYVEGPREEEFQI